MTPEELASRIETFLRAQTGAADVRVSGVRRLTGGASRETWALDADVDGAALPLILQRDTRGATKAMTREFEFRLMRAAFDAGVPAPEPLFMGDDSLGGEFFIVRREDGETLPKRLLRDDLYAKARAAMTEDAGRILAQIHAVPLDTLAELPAPPAGAVPAAYELARYEQVFRGMAPEPHPAFELAFRWLSRQPAVLAQTPVARTLVHGDFRMGNVLFGADGARRILDWELAHAGDPAEDLAWFCVRSWRFGGALPAGGVGTREELFAAYEAAGGAPVDPEGVRWWEIFGNLRWGIICLTQARTYLDGVSDSVELASIGRRTAETEWELLDLVG